MTQRPSSSPPAAPPRPALAPPARFFALDALRGCAALSVVFWHWQHFFYTGTAPPAEIAWTTMPFYLPFAPLYRLGWRAVDLFFCLSGFIFYWLYADRVAAGRVSARSFGALRISRLYPLHIATFMLVAALQAGMRHATGSDFVYPVNDVYHGVLQVFFASAWGLERGYSFNGPIWSVSVEVFLYGLFFATCRAGWCRPWQLALGAAVGLVLIEAGVGPIGRGVLSFFVGGLAFALYARLIVRVAWTPARLAGLAGGVAALWLLVPANAIADGALTYFWTPLAGTTEGWAVAGGVAVRKASGYAYELLLYPATIIALALVETIRGHFGRRLAWLGDISYASYLLHFPLQLTAVLAVTLFGVSRDVFTSPFALVAFFAVLIPLSVVVYRAYERPAMDALRMRWLPARGELRPEPRAAETSAP